ncbi:MBOAT family O-acyltransferase [Cellulomonas endometrii]|uniref:MBOAT family O-acyltransferase n=1 Tax=Cellulomonas endometrii TaxID=3036301 RepID=UPI0024ADB8E7|nr:MBOAT family protein [Cellulomonas endometrii]
MVFSSYTFVFGFLPAFLIAYYLLRPRFRNALILLASLFFYYVGDKDGIVALVGAIVLNYGVGLGMGPTADAATPSWAGRRTRSRSWRLRWMWFGVALNLAVLGWYKYAGFFTSSVDAVAERLGLGNPLPVLDVALPLGISFFVFQGISYLVDVYRGTIAPTRNFVVFGAYKSLFPQLIAGPIVRYRDIADALDHRAVTESMVFQGVVRFVIGFTKKVLLADTFALTADAIFALPQDQLSTSTAWLGTIAYTLQIYFDFSAYSDMAIGMALMMGFRFPENFNYPYTSRSIREFWRRWHMTLSSWFRDYVYIPLGGSRAGKVRTYVNSLIVFSLTGLWHGAAWTFVVWGLWHGLFIVLERLIDLDSRRIPSVLRWAGTMGVVLVGWVLFRAESFDKAMHMLGLLVGIGDGAVGARPFGEFWTSALAVAVVAGLVLSFPVYRWIKERLPRMPRLVAGWLFFSLLFVLASAKVLAGAYSPFLYFRF